MENISGVRARIDPKARRAGIAIVRPSSPDEAMFRIHSPALASRTTQAQPAIAFA